MILKKYIFASKRHGITRIGFILPFEANCKKQIQNIWNYGCKDTIYKTMKYI